MDLPHESEQVTSPWFFFPDNKLSIVHLNIESLLGQARHKNGAGPTDTQRKIDFLRYSVQFENSPSPLCLTETKLGKCIDDSEISLHGYTVYRRDRDRRGGGVAVYHRSDIKASLLANLPSSVEHCALRITPLRSQEFIICCIYRPPSAKSEWCEHIRSLMQSLVDARLPLLITGDINIDLMKDSLLADNLRAEYHLT